jgi:hypothetical protein
MNNLRNYMNDQVKATLKVNGIDYTPEKKELWSKTGQQPVQPQGNTNTGGGQTLKGSGGQTYTLTPQ